jgi:hypothetical protein
MAETKYTFGGIPLKQFRAEAVSSGTEPITGQFAVDFSSQLNVKNPS